MLRAAVALGQRLHLGGLGVDVARLDVEAGADVAAGGAKRVGERPHELRSIDRRRRGIHVVADLRLVAAAHLDHPPGADAALGPAYAHAVEGVAGGAELAVHLEREGVDLVAEDALLDPDAALVGLAAHRRAGLVEGDLLRRVGQAVLGEAGAEPWELDLGSVFEPGDERPLELHGRAQRGVDLLARVAEQAGVAADGGLGVALLRRRVPLRRGHLGGAQEPRKRLGAGNGGHGDCRPHNCDRHPCAHGRSR